MALVGADGGGGRGPSAHPAHWPLDDLGEIHGDERPGPLVGRLLLNPDQLRVGVALKQRREGPERQRVEPLEPDDRHIVDAAADVNNDGTIDGSDFILFINSFAIGDATVDPMADVAGGGPNADQPDGTIDGTDFIDFINFIDFIDFIKGMFRGNLKPANSSILLLQLQVKEISQGSNVCFNEWRQCLWFHVPVFSCFIRFIQPLR